MTSCEQQKNKKCFVDCARLLAGMLMVFLLQGCETPNTRLEGKDMGLFQKSVRASFNLKGQDAASEPRSGQAIEVGYQDTKVSSNQVLNAGQPPIYLSGTAFNSPNQLRNNFDLSYVDIIFRYRLFPNRPIGIEFLGGIASSALDIKTTAPTQSANVHYRANGLQGGVGVIWHPKPKSSVHVRASYFLSMGDVRDILRGEIYYAYALQKNVSAQIGYAYSDVYGSDLIFFEKERFHLRTAGPTVRLNWNLNVGK